MLPAAHISDDEMLARLAARDLAAAERVHDKLMAAEEASEIAELGRTYQRFARSLRQTLALKARFRREQQQDARAANETPPQPARPGGVAVARRIREVRAGVTRVVWDEVEREERDDCLETLEYTIAEECLRDSFCAEPLDDHIARICLALDLSPQGAEGWRDLPDPPGQDDGGPDPESSA